MSKHLNRAGYLLSVVLILLIPSLESSPNFWSWQHRSPSPSIVNISIGNRVNSTATLDDHGTRIRDVALNLSRWNGNLTFARNGTEIFVTKGTDGVTNIRISFDSNSTAVANATTTNSTQPSRRRKRQAFGIPFLPAIPIPTPQAIGIPSLPAIPIPTLNDSQAFLGGNNNPLPSAISNLTSSPAVNAVRNLLQPWQFLQTFLNRRLPMIALDTVVSFLAQLYSSTGKQMVDTGVNALGEITDSLSGMVNSALDMVTDQVSSGIEGVVRMFKDLTRAGQSCVGQVPDDVARQVVSKATGCVRARWNEVDGIVNQFLAVISDTEEAYGGWLRTLDGCNARNFGGLNETALDSAQRQCYVQAIANSVGRMIDIPMRWANLTVRTSTAVTNFQPQVGVCVAGVGAEIASVSANIGLRIVLCQVFQ